jgi:hypothetical protein
MLSGVAASLREAATESKDPCLRDSEGSIARLLAGA